ncbi:MAG TPA: 50S ribosomal protein L11 methyltransferase [Gaiellaceae bacterium]
MLALFPEGFEESERGQELVLSAYTDARGEDRMAAAFGEVTVTDVPADWVERWKRFHRPVSAGGLWIVPPWEDPPRGADSVLIDPGRAFGTGAHPTTRLSLELVSELEPGSLLDIGCGSGVLAIAAAKLGFAPVIGLDSDRHAVEAARANAAANGVELELEQADARVEPLPQADIAVANVNAELVAEVAERVECALFVTSGYFEAHVPSLPRFRTIDRRTLEGWAADLHARE